MMELWQPGESCKIRRPQNPSRSEKARQDLNLLSGNASYPYGVSILVYSPLDPNPTRKMAELVLS